MWRQGDIFIAAVRQIPPAARESPLPHGVLVHGELTGHSHRIEDPRSAALYSGDRPTGELFVDATSRGARIVHEEHGAIDLPPGLYRVWRQREYTPQKIVVVSD